MGKRGSAGAEEGGSASRAKRAKAERPGKNLLKPVPGKDLLKPLLCPGSIGPALAEDLYTLGFRRIEDLAGLEAEALYLAVCACSRAIVDRCVLYQAKAQKLLLG